jgi:DNA-binding SARP family transcriptional activator
MAGSKAVEVRVIGDFSVRVDGQDVVLPPSAQRPVAHLAVDRGPATRPRLAAALWPDCAECTALARLRNAVWKANRLVPGLVTSHGIRVALARDVTVDLDKARDLAQTVLAHADGEARDPRPDLFRFDLLVGWDDQWLEAERESFAVLRLRALEKLARINLDAARFYEAERACRWVIQAEPYRESAHLLLADVLLTEGNAGLALCRLDEFQRLLEHDLGALPSDRMRHLADALRTGA